MRKRFNVDVFMRICGDVLRQARRRLGWYRKHLLAHLEVGLSLQTLATYELATRRISLVRFVEIALALGANPVDLLAEIWERFVGPDPTLGWTIDLVAATRLRAAALAPLRRWAEIRLRAVQDGEPATVRLSLGALEPLAVLCRMDIVELVRRLPRSRAHQPSDDETER